MRFLICLCLSHFISTVSFAYDAKIVAVVGNKAITEKELDDRIKLVLFTSNQKNASPTKMRPQVLDSMISENLQLIAAKEGGVKVTHKEIDQSLANIAKQNNMTVEQFSSFLEKNNVKIESLKSRLKAQLAWEVVVNHGLGNIAVSETEVDKIQQAEAGTIYDVSEITLYTDESSKKGKVKEQAQTIMSQLNSGAPFSVLAQQFSQSTTAQDGGKLGRLGANQLDTVLSSTLSSMKAGETRLVDMPKGYQIVRLNAVTQGKNDAVNTVTFKIAIIPFDESMSEDEQLNVQGKIEKLQGTSSVIAFLKIAKAEQLSVQSVDDVEIDAISPEEFATMLKQAKAPSALKPIRSKEGLQLIFVEKKGVRKNEPLSRKEIKHQLEFEKKSKMAALFLNKLKARTYIINNLSCG